jgi:hypothetical protein
MPQLEKSRSFERNNFPREKRYEPLENTFSKEYNTFPDQEKENDYSIWTLI